MGVMGTCEELYEYELRPEALVDRLSCRAVAFRALWSYNGEGSLGMTNAVDKVAKKF